MTQVTQIPAFGVPFQQLMADSVAMALEGVALSQAEGKRLLENALELGAASARESVKSAEELRGRLTDATGSVNALVKEQVAVWGELPKDPVAATQKVIAASVEGSRRGLELGAARRKG